ncbi:MAG TPA: chloramphenicol acetyltransferase [Anaerolineae bacterium]|nr:chloramphenicol acetyltransferase [Anaerolineae bacterium]
MREIDMQTWARGTHFRTYKDFLQPLFGMCAHVEIGAFYKHIKALGVSLNVAIIYTLTRAANTIPEFRQRIRGNKVVEHDVVHPSTTILVEGGLFSFCDLNYDPNFSAFAVHAEARIAYIKSNPTLEDEEGRDDLLFMTAIPWVSFTSFLHPIRDASGDSFPRIAWGKLFEEGGAMKMPLGVQAHHALMDGLHVGKFYTEVESYLQDGAAILGD